MKKIQTLLSTLEKIHPRLASKAAYQLFCFPPRPEILGETNHLVTEAKKIFDQAVEVSVKSGSFRLKAYHFRGSNSANSVTPKKKVLVIHGWTSASFYMARVIQTLIDENYEVVAFDFPAHGRSSGKFASFLEAVPAILKMGERFGPFDLAVGHSFGSAMLLYAIEGGSPFHKAFSVKKMILFSPPEDISGVIDRFSAAAGLSPRLRIAFRSRIEKIVKRPLKEICGADFLKVTGIPTYLVHDRHDLEIPFTESLKLQSAGGFVTLYETEGLGHRDILIDEISLGHLREAIRI